MRNLPIKKVTKSIVGDLTLWYYVSDTNQSVMHCIDGPAYIDEYGDMGWYVHGKICYTNAEFQAESGISDEEMAIMILKYGNVYF